jgi:hypothetical protein
MNIVLRITLLTTLLAASLAAQGETAIIRTVTGVRYEIPAGWEWTEFDGYNATIRHVGTKSGEKGKESSPNTFQIGVRKTYGDDYNKDWGKLDRDQQRTFPNGTTARWKAGIRFDLHYGFVGEATIGSKALSTVILDTRTPRFDVSLVEAAFVRATETAQNVPESKMLYHPSAGIAVDDILKSPWFRRSYSDGIRFVCQADANGCGKDGYTRIDVYPSSEVFPDIRKALADITNYFEKNASLKIGDVQRADVPGGEVLWTEQPGSQLPFLGAVRRDGRYFFLYVSSQTSRTRTHDTLREDVLAVAKSVRAWDGK